MTGGAGYVGSVLIPKLINNGHKVKCLDRFFFGDEFLSQDQFSEKLEIFHDDIRWFDPKLLDGVDAVLDLAAISNDPAGELNPDKTFEINHMGRLRVAKLSKEHGVKRYILASSASIYGQQEQIADEKSSVNPLTAYSNANRNAEIDTLPLNDDGFTVTILRFSSVYGKSPRMRFDTAVNRMVLDSFKNNKIFVSSKSNKRPFIHINDVARSYLLAITAKKNKIGGQIFNVGSENQNYEMGDLANEIAKICDAKCDIETGETNDPQKINAWVSRSNFGEPHNLWICRFSNISEEKWASVSKGGYFNSLVWKKPASLTETSSSEIESNIIKYINN